jgi:hypothetical protein
MVDVSTIDTINILQAAMLAMRTAVEGLEAAGLAPDHLLIDGNRWVQLHCLSLVTLSCSHLIWTAWKQLDALAECCIKVWLAMATVSAEQQQNEAACTVGMCTCEVGGARHIVTGVTSTGHSVWFSNLLLCVVQEASRPG